MLAHTSEQNKIDEYLTQALSDLTLANALRLKAGLRILMTTDETTFKTICSTSVQKDLHVFLSVLEQPEILAPTTCSTEPGRAATLEYIKKFTVDHLSILDKRTTILPNTLAVKKTLSEDAHLKSVIHTSAIRNVVNVAHFAEAIEKKFKQEGLSGRTLVDAVKRASMGTARLNDFVLANDIQALESELLTEGVDVNLPNEEGLPLLHLAVREGFLKIVERLLKVPGIQVNLVSNSGWTPLHLAARLGDTDMVNLLLGAPRINVNVANSDGWTPLHWAAWHGHTEIVIQLLAAPGIAINPRDKKQTTPLHWAARNGHTDVISLLLDTRGIEVNPVDSDHKTPIYLAVCFDHAAATAAFAADPRVDVNIQDIDGLTPLHWAARNGRPELVQLLLDLPRTRRDLRDNNHMTPADWAEQLEFWALLPLLQGRTKHPWLDRFNKILRNVVDYFRTHLTT